MDEELTWKQLYERIAADTAKGADGYEYVAKLHEAKGEDAQAENAHDNADDMRHVGAKAGRLAAKLPEPDTA